MSTTSTAALATGTANAAKLFVAALAFTSAYVGFSAYGNASSAARPVRSVTLSAREVPVTETMGAPAKAGTLALAALAGGDTACARTYVARTVVVNPDPAEPVQYGWKLARWSPATKTWRTYLVAYDGFAGATRNVEWQPEPAGNPGWYRVELSVKGAKTVKSERFQVRC
ncbi:hypothetical protein ABZ897_08830 [Nonomuraea sp. NPDC046802]|uniref:hypothetical protein n=1 Tax=Nonomuraea sp. NPDC046802 TaxID=3154919 RepID=UPI0034010FAF